MNWKAPIQKYITSKQSKYIDARLETLFQSMRKLFPNEPYVMSGKWSWCFDQKIDLMFHYLPVAFILLSPLDTDRLYCCKYFNETYFHRRQESVEQLKKRAEECNCPLVVITPSDSLSEYAIGQRLKDIIP